MNHTTEKIPRRAFLRTAAVAGVTGVAALRPALAANAPSVAAATTARKGPAWLAPDYTIIARAPSNRDMGVGEPETYFMAMSLVKMPSGKFVAAIPRGKRDPAKGLEAMLIAVSADQGVSWKTVCELPYDSGEPVLFVHGARLYQFLTPNRAEADRRTNFSREGNGRIWVSASDDEGVTWTKPVAVIRGKPNYTSGGQTALVTRHGWLYWTVSERYETLAAVCCPLDRILDPAAWRISELVEMPIPRELIGAVFEEGSGMRCLEGNVVEVGGRLLVVARTIINRLGTANMGGVFEILHDEGTGKLTLKFLQLYPIPGGQCKFYIQYDPLSRLYWMATNLPTNSQDLIGLGKSTLGQVVEKQQGRWSLREDRRLLTLWYSLDALNWIPSGWIAKADGWAQSFMYPVFLIDGDDLALISRTARDSGNFHDADLATFHRIRNFRDLAVDLLPKT